MLTKLGRSVDMWVFIIFGYLLVPSSGKLKLTSVESEEARPWFDLVELDGNITRIMDKPSGVSHEFIRDLFVYWENMEYVLSSVQNNETRGIEAYKKLKVHGGPRHTRVEIKDDQLLHTFSNWTQRDINEIHQVINDTAILWDDISKYMKQS